MRRLSLLALFSVVLAGCGGGGSNSPGTFPEEPGGGTPVTFGDFSLIGTLNTPPIASGDGRTQVYGFAGAVSVARLHDATPTVAETVVAVAGYPSDIYLMNGDGTNRQLIYSGTGIIDSVAIAPAGNRVFFSESGQIKSLTLGGKPVNVTDGYHVSLSPNGTLLAFRKGSTDVWRSATNGANAKKVFTPASGVTVTDTGWLNDGLMIVESSNGSTNYIAKVTLDGIVGGLTQGVNTAASPDGGSFYWTFTDGDTYSSWRALYRRDALNLATELGELSFSKNEVTYLADSRSVLTQTYNDDRGTYTLRPYDLVETNYDNSLGEFVGGLSAPLQLDATPYIIDRPLVGAGSPNTSGAAGLLVGQTDHETRSAVVFNATTKSKAQVKALDEGGGFVYDVWADQLTALAYTNDNTFFFKSALPTSGTVNGAVVTFGSDGKVATVLPYNLARSGHPQVVTEGGRRYVEGDFLAQFDGKGKDLAPGGVKRVELSR